LSSAPRETALPDPVDLPYSCEVSLRADVQLVRETLEGTLAPAVATAVLFDALERWGRGIPANSDEVLELVRGPLAVSLGERLEPLARDELLESIEERLISLTGAGELELDIDLDEPDLLEEEDDDGTRTTQMAAVPHPVVVLVVSSSEGFASRLLTAIGRDRVHPRTVADEPALRHATFSVSPLVTVLDASAPPPTMRASAAAAALKGLPDRTLGVVWAAETPYGREVKARLEQTGARSICLERREGIEPLLDVVLSRFKQTSSLPPPRR
jgi:hypothetical protein